MVHSTARRHFGKVSSRLVIPTSLTNWKQAGMKRFLLVGISMMCRLVTYDIKMTHSLYHLPTDLYQECD
jgi:hypothetical protein